jgi:hypothetical protein
MESLLDTTAGCYERKPRRAPVSPGGSGELKRCYVHLPSTSHKTGAGRTECSAFRAGPATDRSRPEQRLGRGLAVLLRVHAPEAKRVRDLFRRAPGTQRPPRPGRRRAVPPSMAKITAPSLGRPRPVVGDGSASAGARLAAASGPWALRMHADHDRVWQARLCPHNWAADSSNSIPPKWPPVRDTLPVRHGRCPPHPR